MRVNEPAVSRTKKKRADSFLGIHFDFHADDDCTQVGANTTREMVERIIREVNPDYIQIDCKGHRGLSSYPTAVGCRAPGIVGDPLRIWRDVTEEMGVALFLHYSGVWDAEAVKRHPDWARIDADGRPDGRMTSVFGPYADRLMIPQLLELCETYGADGVWVDGECWATAHDYSPAAAERFRAETGIAELPRMPGDPNWEAFSAFCREGFRRYLRHYVDTLHEKHPGFQIASNWAFSSFMPEPVTVDVDYISGDYSLQNSVNSARLEGRCMMKKGRPWDLMAWAFSGTFAMDRQDEFVPASKSAVQLQQEAAVVLALGGGFQAYFQQKKDGSVALRQMRTMAETAAFCRAREPFCHRAEPVPQIALLYSAPAYYRANPRLFAPWGGELLPMQGILQSLLDSQYAVEVLSEFQLTELEDYPLLVVPEWEGLEEAFASRLLEYAGNGGSVLLIGPGPAGQFEEALNLRQAAPRSAGKEKIWLEAAGGMAGLYTRVRRVVPGEGVRVIGRLFDDNDSIGAAAPAATVTRCGSGLIGAVHFDYGERYVNGMTPVARDFLREVVRELFPDPVVTVEGSRQVDVAVGRLNGRLTVNLVNTAGPHANPKVYVYDEIPALGPLRIRIRTDAPPSRIVQEPGGRELPFVYADGTVRLTLDRLPIHEILVVEGGDGP